MQSNPTQIWRGTSCALKNDLWVRVILSCLCLFGADNGGRLKETRSSVMHASQKKTEEKEGSIMEQKEEKLDGACALYLSLSRSLLSFNGSVMNIKARNGKKDRTE